MTLAAVAPGAADAAASTGGIAVVVVNFNSGELLARCLASLAAQRAAPRRVIVVDNASSDGSTDAVRAHPGFTLIREPGNRGFAAATNTGIAHAGDCAWIATLNPDAFAEPGWIEALERATVEYPECASFACRMLQAADPRRLDGAGDVYHVSGLPWRRYYGEPDGVAAQRCGEVFGPCAAAALYRRSVLHACGGFDEQLFCYLEDVDLAFRMRLLGERCRYLPEAVVQHVGAAITGRERDFQLYHGHRNLVWVFVKNMPGALFWLLLPLHLALNLVTLGWFIGSGRARPALRAKRDALRGLPLVWRKRAAVQRARRVGAARIWSALDKGLSRGRRA